MDGLASLRAAILDSCAPSTLTLIVSLDIALDPSDDGFPDLGFERVDKRLCV